MNEMDENEPVEEMSTATSTEDEQADAHMEAQQPQAAIVQAFINDDDPKPGAAHICGCCGALLRLSDVVLRLNGAEYHECQRCGTMQTLNAPIRDDWESKIAALAAGESIEIPPPFRSLRSLEQIGAAGIAGDYLFERGGATLLMWSLGMRPAGKNPTTGALIYTKP